MLMSLTVSADTGPKPYISVELNGLGTAECYATLLSDTDTIGPFSVWNGSEENLSMTGNVDRDILTAFINYKDADGYYYLVRTWRVDGKDGFEWGYMVPSRFKILLYFPETGEFASSEILTQYAFHSYYTVNMADFKVGSGKLPVPVRTYPYGDEILSLLARVVLTIGIELLIALPFGYRSRRQILTVLSVNAITQIGLNLILNIVNYRTGSLISTIVLVPAEIAVFTVEAIVYAILLAGQSNAEKPKRGRAVAYALVANLASLLLGLGIAELIPAIF